MRGHHNWHKRYADAQPLGNRVADALANLIGSWKFIIFQSVIFVIWVFVNTLWLFGAYQFDPYPFILFNLFMSAEAALSFIDTTLKNRDWLVGNRCTIADIGCWGRMVFMAEGGFEVANWPSLEAWSRRLKAMPGFALPYDLIPSKDREFDPE